MALAQWSQLQLGEAAGLHSSQDERQRLQCSVTVMLILIPMLIWMEMVMAPVNAQMTLQMVVQAAVPLVAVAVQ
jgi:hypothetical protein